MHSSPKNTKCSARSCVPRARSRSRILMSIQGEGEMKKILLPAVTAICLLASGCASVMRDAPSQEISRANADKATVVFMRSSMVAAAIGCDLFEVVNGELRFIGQLPTGNKVAYETTPG